MALSSARLRTASASTSMRPGEDRAANRPKITASTSSAPPRMSAVCRPVPGHPQPVPRRDLAEDQRAKQEGQRHQPQDRAHHGALRDCSGGEDPPPPPQCAPGGGPASDQRVTPAERVADGGRDQDRQQRLLAHLARDGLGLPAHGIRRGVKRPIRRGRPRRRAPASPGPSSASRPARATGRSAPCVACCFAGVVCHDRKPPMLRGKPIPIARLDGEIRYDATQRPRTLARAEVRPGPGPAEPGRPVSERRVDHRG